MGRARWLDPVVAESSRLSSPRGLVLPVCLIAPAPEIPARGEVRHPLRYGYRRKAYGPSSPVLDQAYSPCAWGLYPDRQRAAVSTHPRFWRGLYGCRLLSLERYAGRRPPCSPDGDVFAPADEPEHGPLLHRRE